MSALPRQGRRLESRQESGPLVDALKSAAKTREHLSFRDAQIRQAIDNSAEELVYRWQTPDDREAEMKVFYRVAEETDLLATQLSSIDYRQPTIQERARYEDEFDAEMIAAGDLWLDVASHMAH